MRLSPQGYVLADEGVVVARDEAGIEVTAEDAAYGERVVICGEWDSKHNTVNLAKRCIEDKIPGDFVECGINAGGQPALMAYAIERYGSSYDATRLVHLFDSFEGHPQAGLGDCREYQAQLGLNLDQKKGIASGVFIATLEQVQLNMFRWNVPDRRLIYHKGWLQEVLPAIVDKFPTIALLRVDVDLHDSTIPVFEYLYDKVAPGGYIISDDWGSEALDAVPVNGPRKATLDFFDRRGLPHPKVTQLPRATSTVWWRKP